MVWVNCVWTIILSVMSICFLADHFPNTVPWSGGAVGFVTSLVLQLTWWRK